MKSIFTSVALLVATGIAAGVAVLAPSDAFGAATNIAQVPLLNITGTGTVKPNLMLLLDNSGSMDQSYTPDYVNDNLCRSGAQLSSASPQACNVGFPPFMSSDFNKQYYNPTVRYQAPIKYDGTYYPDQTAAATTNYTVVSGDGFGAHKVDLYGSGSTSINLLTGFPDVKWCTSSNGSSCQSNTASYTYPDNTYTTPVQIFTGPYYYSIGVAEYCADATLTVCKSVSVGGSAPSGYPVPAKVRWCNSTLLNNCQAKNTGTYVYPRYSTPSGSTSSYGTIALGTSASTSSMTITKIVVGDANSSAIVNSTITASTGVKTALTQQTMASALAAAINNRSTTLQYMGCVKDPIGSSAAVDCQLLGIALTSDNVVAVVPVVCSSSSTPKTTSTCIPVTDNSRAGAGFTVTAPSITPTPATTGVPPTALLAFSGTSSSSGTPAVTSLKLGSTALISSNFNLGNRTSVTSVVSAIQAKIGTGGTIRAYVGGNAVTSVCAAQTTSVLCLVDTSASANGAAPTVAFSSASGMSATATAAASAPDAIPTTTNAIAAGSSPASTFVRTNIVSGQTYPKANTRTDCVTTAGVCTYTEEMVNFANWYVYYKTRIQMMKTSVGIAFSTLTSNYNVGFARLSALGAGGAVDIKPAAFTGTARSTWYTTLYNTTDTGSTPMRPAMDNVGRMFANLAPYNYATGSEVVQYPCQQNFMILTTDGYWNGGSTSNVVNNDNAESPARFCTAARGCVDTRPQSQPSISDVSLHWYNGGSDTGTVSLRPSLEPNMNVPGSVPAGPGENSHLHMNTYTLGLGVDGIMNYEPNYDTAPAVGGDFYNLITSVASGCPWNGGAAYVWPDPDVTNTASTVQSRVDDLWHAAINGHGKYFSAALPTEVVAGISAALANIQVRTGSAAAAATSTPNITQQDNDIFSDTFTTVRWYGELSDKKIDPTTGIVGTAVSWDSSNTVGLNVAAATDSRTIKMLDVAHASSGAALADFQYASLASGDKAWFDNKCASLPQCTLLSTADKAIVNSGANVINWLRGQQQYADDSRFRAYTLTSSTPAVPIVLGDIASSKPAYVRDPRKNYTDPDYAIYKAKYASRLGTVYTAANDGMLHAFNAADGTEVFAYVPRTTMKKLYLLSSTTYGTNHEFTTDGSPAVADVKLPSPTGWATVLVAGLNGGGRGFYALDVTAIGTSPGGTAGTAKALWELCADPAVCANNDPDIGLTFGNPQFGTWNGKWVVFLTSGYNNIPGSDNVNLGSGQGILFIVDAATGTILKKVSTGAGNTTTPSGFAKITAIGPNPDTDPTVSYVYGGDNNGTMWRFDLTDSSSAATVGVVKMGDAGTSKPITTRPDVTLCAVTTTVTDPTTHLSSTSSTAQRVVVYGTGRLLDVPDTADTSTQSLYVLKDSGSNISDIRGATMVQQTLSLSGSSSNVNTYAITNNPVDLSVKNGWFVDWNLNPGERMNLDPQIVGGVVNVVTNIPTSSSACSVGGTSNSYALNVCNGNAVGALPPGGTLSNTSAAVGFIIIRLPNGDLKMITTTANGNTLTTPIGTNNTVPPRRAGWRRVKGE